MVVSDYEESTSAEKYILELRELVTDVLKEWKDLDDDWNLIRWLQAQDMDVKKAERMIRNTFKWRLENNVEELIATDPPQSLVDRIPMYADGFSHDGLLVITVETGKMDFRSLVEEFGKEQFLRFCIQFFSIAEKVVIEMNRMNNKGKRITKDSFKGAVIIHDYKHFSYRQIQSFKAIQTNIEMMKMNTNHFPEMTSQLMVINCNMFAQVVMKSMRSIVESPRLRLEVYGENRSEWTRAIQSRIPADQIREPFGGTKTEKFQLNIKPEVLIEAIWRRMNCSEMGSG